ncbi:MAG: metal-dependent transcriptional regulator [Candidatus Krumholzibacteria bacterium]|nr:metal-dependent transcriptional regulator [Candidatus Krumholzibacteria bacterium]
MGKKLSSNMEMYLKTILRLGQDDQPVRVKAIAESLEITMPSVSEALRTLKSKGLVLHPSYGEVKLSARGARLAEGINNRFVVLQRFLAEVLKVDEKTAEHEACEIEHVLGADTFMRLTAYLDFLSNCQKDLSDIVEHFHEYLEWRLAGEACPVCGSPGDQSTTLEDK